MCEFYIKHFLLFMDIVCACRYERKTGRYFDENIDLKTCCSPFSLSSPKSESLASIKLSFRIASVGSLHKYDGVSVV